MPAFGAFRELLARFERTDSPINWVRTLVNVLFDAPFFALFPDFDEAYAFRVDGCVDMGQLTVLLADALPEPLSAVSTETPKV